MIDSLILSSIAPDKHNCVNIPPTAMQGPWAELFFSKQISYVFRAYRCIGTDFSFLLFDIFDWLENFA